MALSPSGPTPLGGDLEVVTAGVGEPPTDRIAQPVGGALRQAGLVAPLPKLVTKPGRSERRAVSGQQFRKSGLRAASIRA